ncbi:NAD(P)/FAD-dependent oxidoreductase [Bradymonas sediminis]|uniref:NAD(P)/FAD-dependent oxidoreductase n=2 Tax=Bradymonas sediminis TaxID=1548548 RepID=A0A2Z4FIE6_9DELT|nr:NAD(P)/FAD-dependent oxidoreductase [Bradymonas sediminis]
MRDHRAAGKAIDRAQLSLARLPPSPPASVLVAFVRLCNYRLRLRPKAAPGALPLAVEISMHFIIVGNGVAGIQAALTLRERLPDPATTHITIISDESDYFISRTALMYAYTEKLQRRDLEPYERRLYRDKHLTLRRARVVDLDADAKTVTLGDGESLAYDGLLLSVGAKPRSADFAGLDKVRDGLVNFVSLQDLDHCERLTPTTRRAVIVGGGLIGIELVECLRHHGVEVTFLVRSPWFWPAALGADEGEFIAAHMREHGVDLRLEEQVQEVKVDENGRVCAVRTESGEEIDCQMLGVAIGVTPNCEWLRAVKTPPALARGIRVDRAFRTSLPQVWAAGDCAEIDQDTGNTLVETIWYSAKRHGILAAQSMLGDPVRYETPVFFNSSKFFDIEFTTVGDLEDAPPGSTTLYRKMPERPISQRIVANAAGEVIGFNMLGSRFDHRILTRWIQEKRGLDWVRDNLEHAQFDVEFGRVPLQKMTETTDRPKE